MYHRYFGLTEAPFSIAVNPRYLFMSARHRDALAHLLYGVGVGGGFILLTGEVGTGKTTVNRCLLEQLPENTDIALILNPALSAIELLATVCDELGIVYQHDGEQSLKALTDNLHQFLLANHTNDRNTVLLIDEAQHLQFDVLEQIRLLTNLETNTKKLLQIILVGQPELRTLLNKPELRQLAQRITARYQLKPLNLEETQAYIHHRLQVAGLPANQELFPNNVVKATYKISRGVPRIINVLCDRMLLGAYGKNRTTVDKAILKQATLEVMGEEEDIQLQLKSSTRSIAAAIAAVAVAGLLWWQWPTMSQPAMAQQTLPSSLSPAIPPTRIQQELQAPTPEISTQARAENTLTQPSSAPIANTSSPLPLWFDTAPQAINELIQAGGWPEKNIGNPCVDNANTRLRCEQLTVKTWQALLAYNRPAVLTLITRSKMQVYATLVAVKNGQAILSHNGETSSMSLHQLGEIWSGDFIFIWQPAAFYTGPIAIRSQGPMVKWLAEKFAELDGQKTLLAEQTFNASLQQRVNIFQQENLLQADGVVGLKTLLKLNEQLGPVKTLNQPTVASMPTEEQTLSNISTVEG
ncbi:MAG: AAA family ATPase [Pseudomonadales bacterium]